ncbi:MAG: hypothetical protein H9917_03420 [Candidatus Oceanisphaera merdipullorum]|nr:hypothetical protein [Candidatus Oceanisphaera merdipullorum]
MQMLGGKPQGPGQQAPAQGGQYQGNQQSGQQRPSAPNYNKPPIEYDDDIPFAPIGLQYRNLPLVM